MNLESPTPHFAPEPLRPTQDPTGPYNFDMGYYQDVTEEHAKSMSRDELIDNLHAQNIKWVEAVVEGNLKEAAKRDPVIDVISVALDRRVTAEHRADKRNNRRK